MNPQMFREYDIRGITGKDTGGAIQQGSVAIFQRSGDPGTWGLTHEFFGELNHQLGSAVDLAGINVIAAAQLDGLGVGTGGARWFTQGNLDGAVFHYAGDCRLLPDAQAAHVGRKTVAVNTDATAVLNAALGMPDDDEIALNNGKVLIFDLSSDCAGSTPTNTKTPVLTLYPPDTSQGVQFGSAVTFSGSTLAVGAPGLSSTDSGKVYLYERGATNLIWNPAGILTLARISPVVARCQGGTALAMTADHFAAGCPEGGNPQNEAAYAYSLEIFSDGFESGNVTAWQ